MASLISNNRRNQQKEKNQSKSPAEIHPNQNAVTQNPSPRDQSSLPLPDHLPLHEENHPLPLENHPLPLESLPLLDSCQGFHPVNRNLNFHVLGTCCLRDCPRDRIQMRRTTMRKNGEKVKYISFLYFSKIRPQIPPCKSNYSIDTPSSPRKISGRGGGGCQALSNNYFQSVNFPKYVFCSAYFFYN